MITFDEHLFRAVMAAPNAAVAVAIFVAAIGSDPRCPFNHMPADILVLDDALLIDLVEPYMAPVDERLPFTARDLARGVVAYLRARAKGSN